MKIKSLTKVTDESGLKGTSLIWRASILLTLLGLALYAVGFATNRWCVIEDEMSADAWNVTADEAELDEHFGLWRRCVEVTVEGEVLQEECEDTDDDDAWKPASKAMCCVGLILAVFGLVIGVVAGSMHSSKLMAFGGVVLILGAVTAAVGGAIFEGKSRDEDDRIDPGYSVFLALIGCMCLILGGGGQLMSIRTGYSTIA